MRHEVDWCSAVNFIKKQYQTDEHDVPQLVYDTLLEH